MEHKKDYGTLAVLGRFMRRRWKKPITALVKMRVDGADVTPELVAKKNPAGTAHVDHYHIFRMPKPTPGKHTAEVTIRKLADGSELSHSVEFAVGG